MDKRLKKLIELDIKTNAQEQILKAVKKWGLEGTEDKIKDLYEHMPKLRDIMLKEYYNIVRKK